MPKICGKESKILTLSSDFKKRIIFTSVIMILFLSMNYNFIYSHELIHKKIFKIFNIDSRIEIPLFGLLGGYTIPTSIENYRNLPDQDYIIMNSLHIENEIISYNMQNIFYILFLIFSILFAMLFRTKKA